MLKIILLLSFCNLSVFANEAVQVGRYSYIDPVATPQQMDILSVVVEIRFNSNIETVGDAIKHVLSRSGYRLAPIESSDPAMLVLMKSRLPLVHRSLGPITIDDALRTLSGSAWDLIIDPVHRYVSFDLFDRYKKDTIVTKVTFNEKNETMRESSSNASK